MHMEHRHTHSLQYTRVHGKVGRFKNNIFSSDGFEPSATLLALSVVLPTFYIWYIFFGYSFRVVMLRSLVWSMYTWYHTPMMMWAGWWQLISITTNVSIIAIHRSFEWWISQYFVSTNVVCLLKLNVFFHLDQRLIYPHILIFCWLGLGGMI